MGNGFQFVRDKRDSSCFEAGFFCLGDCGTFWVDVALRV
jgi:hypothetical protein